jgi:hypothetical protein
LSQKEVQAKCLKNWGNSTDYISPEEKSQYLIMSFSDDFDVYLVYDLPTTVYPVRLEDFEQWNLDTEELYEQALVNLESNVEFIESSFDMGKNVTIYYLSSSNNDLFSTSSILLLDEKYIGSHGVLIGIPNRLGAIIYPIDENFEMSFFEVIMPAMVGMYNDGPGSISYNLYHFQSEYFWTIPLTQMDSGYFYMAPEEIFP